MPDVARIHTCRQFLRGRQDGGNGLFVVLEFFQESLANLTIIGCHSFAITFLLTIGIDHIPDLSSMSLGGTEHDGFLCFVYLAQELLYTGFIPLTNLDIPLVEVLFGIYPTLFHIATNHLVIWRVDIVVDVAHHVDMTERRQEAIFDTLFQGVLIGMIREILIGIHVLVYARCCCQS